MNCRRIRPTLLIVAIVPGMAAPLALASYCVGRRVDPELCFLDPRRAPTVDEASIAQPINYTLRSHEVNTVVFLGDSTCRTGVDPRSLGIPAYNLGSLRGLGPSGFLLTLKAYLGRHAKPGAVVLVATPFCFEVDPSSLDGELSGRVSASYGPEVGSVSMLEAIVFVTKRGAASILQGSDVRDRPLVGLERETYRSLESKMRETRGFFGLPGLHGHVQGVPLERPEKPVHPDWDRGIRSIAQACNDAGVPLLIRFAPISAEYREARDFTQLDRWARELESSHSNTTVARPIVLPYDAGLMWDGIHLNGAGVEQFMPVVVKDVQAALRKG
jgi:hypothetical protein